MIETCALRRDFTAHFESKYRVEQERLTVMTPSIPCPSKMISRDETLTVSRAVRWLSLAAAPTFAIMALLSAVPGGGPMDALCSAAGGSPLGGMTPMYLLMSAFHLAPWLKLISGRRNTPARSRVRN